MAIQYFDEARHMGALEVMRQIHVHIEAGDGILFTATLVLNPDRVQDVLDAYFVNGNAACVGPALNIFYGACVHTVILL